MLRIFPKLYFRKANLLQAAQNMGIQAAIAFMRYLMKTAAGFPIMNHRKMRERRTIALQ